MSLPARLLDLAFPAACAGCGREGEALCAKCRPALDARLERPPGELMGLPCVLPAPLLQLEWCAPFRGTVRDALHALKYSGERRLAVPCGMAAAGRWRRAGAGGDLIVPVPIHRDRARERGYDQAVLLATVVARELDLPMARVLERYRATTAQFELNRAERATNVAGVFRVRPQAAWGREAGARSPAGAGTRPVADSGTGPLAGRWVVLIDDVTTTGATLAACARALMAAGALAVSGLTVARER